MGIGEHLLDQREELSSAHIPGDGFYNASAAPTPDSLAFRTKVIDELRRTKVIVPRGVVKEALDLPEDDTRHSPHTELLGERSMAAAWDKAMDAIAKPTNPKDALGITRTPLHLAAGPSAGYLAVAKYLGATKYGAHNFRAIGIRASVYFAACLRHLWKWWNGEEMDSDGTPHLANALACIDILIDCKHSGKLTDDRPPAMDLNPLFKQVEGWMEAIQAKYGHMTPKHWNINDEVPK